VCERGLSGVGTLHRDVVLGTLHRDIVLGTLHRDIFLGTLHREIVLGTLHREIVLGTLHREIVLAYEHEGIDTVRILPHESNKPHVYLKQIIQTHPRKIDLLEKVEVILAAHIYVY
jgi:hypothetical protein